MKRLVDRIRENPNVPAKAHLKVASAIFSRRRRSLHLSPTARTGSRARGNTSYVTITYLSTLRSQAGLDCCVGTPVGAEPPTVPPVGPGLVSPLSLAKFPMEGGSCDSHAQRCGSWTEPEGLLGDTTDDSDSEDCSSEAEASYRSDSDSSYQAAADLRKALRDSVAGPSGGLAGEGGLDLANWPPAQSGSPVIETLHLYLQSSSSAEGVEAFRASCQLDADDLDGGFPSFPSPCLQSCEAHMGPCDCCGYDAAFEAEEDCHQVPVPGPAAEGLPHQAFPPARQGSGAVDGILEELLGTTVLEVLVEPRDPRNHFRSYSF